MTDSRRKSGLALCLVATSIVALLYVLSSGPGNWLYWKGYVPEVAGNIVYAPLFWIVDRCPESVQKGFGRWLSYWHPSDWDETINEQIGEEFAREMFKGIADDFVSLSATEDEELDSNEPNPIGETAGEAQPTAEVEDTPIYYFRKENSAGIRQHDEVGSSEILSEIASGLKAAGIYDFDLQISVKHGVIILDGTVSSPDQRLAAERLAASVAPSMRIDNRFRIAASDE
ncbi:MAG: BON domain-containing protein [Deltaproteobacteria bacterium]